MMFTLQWIDLNEWGSLVVLIGLLLFIGHHVSGGDYHVQRASVVIATVSFIWYCLEAVGAWGAATPTDLMYIVIRAVFAAGMVLGAARILLPLLILGYRQIPKMPPARPASITLPPVIKEVSQPEPTPPPPALTAKEKADNAKLRHQERIEIIDKAISDSTENAAAKLRSKQIFLKDIDEVMN